MGDVPFIYMRRDITARTVNKHRLQAIMDILAVEKTVPTEELADRLEVSMVTIRRDLKKLQDSGKIVNGYGFVQIIESKVEQDIRFSKRLSSNRREKEALAQAALKFVEEGDVLFLDESSTCYVLASALAKNFRNLHIITNAVHTLLALAGAVEFTVESSGGSIQFGFNSLIGPRAEATLNQIYANKFFFSCRAFRNEQGTYELSPFSASIKRVMLNNSQRSFLLVDHTKIGAISPYPFAKAIEIDTMIIDKKVDGLPYDQIKTIVIAENEVAQEVDP